MLYGAVERAPPYSDVSILGVCYREADSPDGTRPIVGIRRRKIPRVLVEFARVSGVAPTSDRVI